MNCGANEYLAAESDTQFPMPDVSDHELERATSEMARAATFHCTQYWLCPF